jgi:hypothetical protein
MKIGLLHRHSTLAGSGNFCPKTTHILFYTKATVDVKQAFIDIKYGLKATVEVKKSAKATMDFKKAMKASQRQPLRWTWT